MDSTEVLEILEETLSSISNKKLLLICEKYFFEEDFGSDIDSGMIDDMYNLILDEAEINNDFAKDIYFYLLNEKITIDEDEFYSEEEIDHG